ncbi:cyclic nucleotide-gated ion channel 1-like isoform X2 [Argentina anserina]|uniref:cyclic nucleotide-gated ion channel 1-like isoform X2 n=1 Tax=Argentina anserina TaxID=57926 RepID=UPI0021769030|nr:cyclic nucleotide-gated ion channel 1-like isoform X2 [Potentilla anserina]
MAVQMPRIRSRDIEENGEELTQKINGTLSTAKFASVNSAVNKVCRVFLEPGFERLQSFLKTMKIYYGVLSIGLSSKKKILDRQALVQQRWNEMLLVLCVIALSLDPLFCYVLVVNDEKKCLRLDRTLGVIATVLRFIVDFFYVFYIIYQFRVSVVTLSSHSSKEGELAPHTQAKAWRYLFLFFIFDILVVLPLPQALYFIVIFQYVLRALRICSLLNEATRSSGILAETAWAKAAFNLFLYLLASHVVGAFWYFFSIERKASCWRKSCKIYATAHCSLYCDDTFGANTFLNDSCSLKTPNSTFFDFGIYHGALESGVIESTDFVTKISYCFWWGLQNLSSLGQSLKTSTYLWEVYFSVFVSLSGLILFAFLIGNMQTFLQSKTVRLEEMRLKGQEIELWMAFHSLPRKLKKRIWKFQKYKWQETRGVDVESFLHNLPRDIRRETKKHLCYGPLSKVPMLQNKDPRLLDAICDHLKPVLYIEHSFILRKGDPLDEMLFITRGKVWTYTTTNSAGADCLEKGDFYGQELLDWVLKTYSNPNLSNLPFSTETVQAHTKVEVFVIKANDLKNVVSKFWWLFPSSVMEQSRKPRAAQALQAAWRRYKQLQKTPRSKDGSVSRTENSAIS